MIMPLIKQLTKEDTPLSLIQGVFNPNPLQVHATLKQVCKSWAVYYEVAIHLFLEVWELIKYYFCLEYCGGILVI